MEKKDNKEIENKNTDIIIKKNIETKINENNNDNIKWYIKYKKIITIIVCILIVILFIIIIYYKNDSFNLFNFSVTANSIDTLKNKDAEKLSIENDWDLETEIQKLIKKQNIYIQEKKI